ncbi:MAG: DUF1501 domain-containing protein [Gemmataceae bacterium]
MDRRQFSRLIGYSALAASVPAFVQKTGAVFAGNARRDIPPLNGLRDNHVLVLIQLAGGNDGLNTVVPYGDDAYYRSRPKIAIEASKVLRLNDHLGLHPELIELHRLHRDGRFAVVTNVGYPNPNRSHFRSMDIWETASPADRIWRSGWLGRYFDSACRQVPGSMLGLRIGDQEALSFKGETNRAATFSNPSLLQSRATGRVALAMEEMSRIEETRISALDFIQRTGSDTRGISQQIQQAVRDVRSAVDYPPFRLCQSLRLVAQMITAGVPTRIYYVTHGGFDTHANQSLRHSYLLQELSQAIGLFCEDLRAQGQLDRVLGITFSEFGRRIDENRNAGTDHGTANNLFLFGAKVQPGVHGGNPDLARRDDQGDLIFRTDFRSVYAGVLRDWLNADSARILEGEFPPMALVRR